MTSPVTAVLITSTTTVLLAALTGAAALWRVGRTRRYERRILHVRELQDRSAQLRAADRAYNRDQIARSRRAAAQQDVRILGAADESGSDADVIGARQIDTDQAVAYDAVRIAATRVEERVLVELNERWRRLSRLAPLEVKLEDENAAWDDHNDACAQILQSGTARLRPADRRRWEETIRRPQASID